MLSRLIKFNNSSTYKSDTREPIRATGVLHFPFNDLSLTKGI